MVGIFVLLARGSAVRRWYGGSTVPGWILLFPAGFSLINSFKFFQIPPSERVLRVHLHYSLPKALRQRCVYITCHLPNVT